MAENAGPWDLAEQNEQQINTRVFWNRESRALSNSFAFIGISKSG